MSVQLLSDGRVPVAAQVHLKDAPHDRGLGFIDFDFSDADFEAKAPTACAFPIAVRTAQPAPSFGAQVFQILGCACAQECIRKRASRASVVHRTIERHYRHTSEREQLFDPRGVLFVTRKPAEILYENALHASRFDSLQERLQTIALPNAAADLRVSVNEPVVEQPPAPLEDLAQLGDLVVARARILQL